MNTEIWIGLILFVCAGVTFWFVDWKNRVEKFINDHHSEFSEYKKDTDKCKTDLIERLHQTELQLALKLTRDEITEFKQEIKNDFIEIKKEFRLMIRELKGI